MSDAQKPVDLADIAADPKGATAKMQEQWAAAIAKAGVATEVEMRDAKEPWPKSLEELAAYIRSLVERPHDYGTCCYAMSLSAVAASI